MINALSESVGGLAAVILVGCLGFCAYVLARKLTLGDSLRERYCGFYICACWLLTVLFHLLIGVGQFNLLAALPLALAGSLLTWRFGSSPGDVWRGIGSDLARLRAVVLRVWRRPLAIAAAPFVLFALVMLARAMFLPLMGWDALTYHGLKAGLWVQDGAQPSYDAPGPWEYYRYFFYGGELFTAWAMLPFHSDLAAGLPDFVHWLFLGVSLYSLAIELGMRPAGAIPVVCFLLWLPPQIDAVGSGYVDVVLDAQLLVAMLFSIKFLRTRHWGHLVLACAAMGLAIDIKATALTCVALLGMVLLAWLAFNGAWRLLRGRLLLGCLAAFLASFLPAWLYHASACGYLLGSTPIGLGPFRMGFLAPNMAWLIESLHVKPHDISSELHAFQGLVAAKLTPSSIVTCLAGLIAVFGLAKKQFWPVALMCACVIAVCINVYQPSFKVVRLLTPNACGRFLMPAVMLATVLGAVPIMRQKTPRLVYSAFLIGSAYLPIATYTMRFVNTAFFLGLAVSVIAVAVTNVITVACVISPVAVLPLCNHVPHRRLWLRVAIVALLATSAMPLVQKIRDCLHIRAYARMVQPSVPRYWVPALAKFEREPAARRLAVTAGPKESAFQWFVYPFLGSHLENRVYYVSPTQEGDVVPHHPTWLAGAKPDYEAWWGRLRQRQITHVMSFTPTTWELQWMETHDDRFTRLVGDGKQWGLYRLKSL